MDTKIDLKIKNNLDQYEVIGSGKIITSPRQVGDWYVTPLKDWSGEMPPEAQQKLIEFLRTGTPFVGLLIADDVRDIEYKRQQDQKKLEQENLAKSEADKQRRQEQTQKVNDNVHSGLRVAGNVAGVIAMGTLLAPLTAISLLFDPMLVAVLPPDEEDLKNGKGGKWICLASWWD